MEDIGSRQAAFQTIRSAPVAAGGARCTSFVFQLVSATLDGPEPIVL